MKITSCYIHIPYCLRKCHYCDFASVPLAGREDDLAAYPQLLHKEWQLWHARRDDLRTDTLRTVYFGGGTPSLLLPQQVAEVLAWLPPAEEVTLEANPETVDEEKLAAFRKAGVNRLSIGVQSFCPHHLRNMGRGHSAEQAQAAVQAARLAGFENISIDLIYGLPEQTLEEWRADLHRALQLGVEHISLYGLGLHEGTHWGDLAAGGLLTPADEDLSADMLELAVAEMTAAGYGHYEISNFAREGYESRHNLAYWQRDNYLGLGVAAAGCLADFRYSNVTTPEAYAAMLHRDELPWAMTEQLSIEEVLAEAVFLGLRTGRGIVFAEFEARYGTDPRRYFKKPVARLERLGLLQVEESGMRLTERGMMLGNEAFMEFV